MCFRLHDSRNDEQVAFWYLRQIYFFGNDYCDNLRIGRKIRPEIVYVEYLQSNISTEIQSSLVRDETCWVPDHR